jgi:predicted MPP superfamily phosphohydrolase
MWRLIPLIIIPGLQFLLWRHSRQWIPATARRARILHAGIFVLFNGILLGLAASRQLRGAFEAWTSPEAAKVFYIWIIATGILSVIILLGSILSGLTWLVHWVSNLIPPLRRLKEATFTRPAIQRFDASRRVFLRRGMYGLTATTFGTTTYGLLQSSPAMEITRQTIPIRNLPPAFEGATIGIVSDIHSSPSMSKENMDLYVRELLGLKPDLIVVTGDFVTSQTEEVYPFTEAFGALKAPLGVYGVMGNHDFYTSRPEFVAQEITRCGIQLLRNDGVTLQRGSDAIALLGIDDTGRPERAGSMMATARLGASRPDTSILLSHRPYFLPEAASRNIDLMISGHTHGGQIVFGRLGDVSITPAQLFSPYVWGKYARDNTQLFVTRGIGTVGLPVRMNCAPELVLLTLTRGTSQH